MQPITAPGGIKSVVLSIKGDAALKLTPGDTVKGEVVRAGGGGEGASSKVAIRIMGKLVEAHSEVPLKEGAQVRLTVEESKAGKGSDIRLRLIQDPQAELKTVLKGAMKALEEGRMTQGDMKSFSAKLDKLPQALLDKLPTLAAIKKLMSSFEGLTGKELKKALKGSGLFMEAKLKGLLQRGGGAGLKGALNALLKGDLKGALLQLKAELQGDKILEELAKTGLKAKDLESEVDKLLRTIEYHQLKSKLTETLDFYIPIFWKSLKDGSLVIREGEADKDGKKSCLCTVKLDLEGTGKVETSVLLERGSLHVSIRAENPHFVTLIEEESETLKERFVEIGLRLASINASVEEDLPFKSDEGTEHGLNITA